MDLILWRHADADPGGFDLARELTPRGREQAVRVAAWLRERLPERYSVLASPAVRAQQTAQALKHEVRTVRELAPGATPAAILAAAGSEGTVVVVGHQPDLGKVIAYVVCGQEREWPLDKGALWWISGRAVRAVVSPDLL